MHVKLDAVNSIRSDSMFDPYAPPRAALEEPNLSLAGVCRRGRTLLVWPGARFPDLCYVCGRPETARRFSYKRRWMRPIARLALVMVGLFPLWAPFVLAPMMAVSDDRFWMLFIALIYGAPVVAIIAYLILARRVSLDACVCATHQRRRRLGAGLYALAAMFLLIGLTAGLAVTLPIPETLRAIMWLGFPLMLVTGMIAEMLIRLPRIKRYSDEGLLLTGFGKQCLALFPESTDSAGAQIRN